MKEELRKFRDWLINNDYDYLQIKDIDNEMIDDFINSLPNGEASRVSENELPKEVCDHIFVQTEGVMGTNKCVKCGKIEAKQTDW